MPISGLMRTDLVSVLFFAGLEVNGDEEVSVNAACSASSASVGASADVESSYKKKCFRNQN